MLIINLFIHHSLFSELIFICIIQLLQCNIYYFTILRRLHLVIGLDKGDMLTGWLLFCDILLLPPRASDFWAWVWCMNCVTDELSLQPPQDLCWPKNTQLGLDWRTNSILFESRTLISSLNECAKKGTNVKMKSVNSLKVNLPHIFKPSIVWSGNTHILDSSGKSSFLITQKIRCTYLCSQPDIHVGIKSQTQVFPFEMASNYI